jgi:hypothetical protein
MHTQICMSSVSGSSPPSQPYFPLRLDMRCRTGEERTARGHWRVELLSPQSTELRSHNLAIGDVALEDADVTRELVHAGYERL